MSAYLVEAETISRILYILEIYHYSDGQKHLVKPLIDAGYSLDSSIELQRLGQAMYSLNNDAINQRYKESDEIPLLYIFSSKQCSELQAFKSMNCWNYQCYEGNIPDSPLFKVFEEVRTRIAFDLVQKIPEYETANWS